MTLTTFIVLVFGIWAYNTDKKAHEANLNSED